MTLPDYLIPRLYTAPRHCGSVPEDGAFELREICDRLGIRYRLIGGNPPLVRLDLAPNRRGHTPTGRKIFLVDAREVVGDEPEHSLRILECLAYAFHDLGAKESLVPLQLFRRRGLAVPI